MVDSGEKIVGIVERIIFNNKDNGYHILSVELPNNKNNVVINAFHPVIHEGLTYEFVGNWENHPRFGKQMKAKSVFEIPPNTKEGLKAYLSSSFFPGIGPVISNRIINHFKDNVIKVFNEDIDQLLLVPGISPKKLKAIKKSWEENSEINDVMMFLQQFGISTVYAAKIYKHYGKGCVQKIKENPYSMAKDISGIGFKYADKIALEVGVEPDSEVRIRACILHILESGNQDGHCYLLSEQIKSGSKELLGIDIHERIDFILKYMIQDNEIMSLNIEGDEKIRYYSKRIYYNEQYCANKIGELLLQKYDEISEGMIGDSVLSEEQKEAVLGVVSKGVSVLTGAAGCGKTFTTKKIIDVFIQLDKNISICAPTGRASSRIRELTGHEASTIHRLLGFNPEEKGFFHNEKNKLEIDVLIIDECSMVDINLANSLLRAVPDDCQVILIGDYHQLPSIGAGNFFKDLIESGVVPVYRLTKIFRQGKESQIIKYAHDIKNGNMPKIDSPLIKPEIWKDGSDCMFIDSGIREYNKKSSEYPKYSSLKYGKDVIEMVKTLYLETVKKYHNIDDIQILIPFKISEYGTIKMNEIIQQEVNPPSKNKPEIKINDKIFRSGDKVIQTVNNPELEIFNGEIGWIESINKAEEVVNVNFNGRIVAYKKYNLIELELSYAISIHKSQGSSFKCVIMMILNQFTKILSRNIIYTGITRSEELAIIIGHRHALEKSIKNDDSFKRQTSLKELLIKNNIFNSLIAP